MNELVSATTGLMRRALGEAVQIESRLADGIWPVEVDRGQLQSALVNICINARDAMPEGGSSSSRPGTSCSTPIMPGAIPTPSPATMS